MIGLVGQDSHIFSESLRFNITMGRDSEVEDNTQDISNFFGQLIEEIPYFKSWGIDLASKINPAELSVGQKQLLAAVRALYWKRPIILFDEIASALDSRLELALRRVIKIIQKNSLVFIIAHRVETVLDADRIIAMDQGRINGIGNHQELLEKSIYYKNFIDELMQTPKS